MGQPAEATEFMEMPCRCDLCGDWFDLNDGNGCKVCHQVYCEDCLEEPFDTCKNCES